MADAEPDRLALGDFVCPECGDHYVAEAECVRCGVPSVSAQRTLFASKGRSARRDPVPWIDRAMGLGIPSLVGVTLGAMCIDALRPELAFAFGVPGLIGLGVIVAPLVREAARRLEGWHRGRTLHAVPLASPEADGQTVARVRGRLRVDHDVDGRHVSVVDESGKLRVRIAEGSDADMFERGGETRYASDGDLVECVGVPRPTSEVGDGYRSRTAGVELDARTVHVLERKKSG